MTDEDYVRIRRYIRNDKYFNNDDFRTICVQMIEDGATLDCDTVRKYRNRLRQKNLRKHYKEIGYNPRTKEVTAPIISTLEYGVGERLVHEQLVRNFFEEDLEEEQLMEEEWQYEILQ